MRGCDYIGVDDTPLEDINTPSPSQDTSSEMSSTHPIKSLYIMQEDHLLDPTKTTEMKTPDKLNPHLDKICKERFGKPFWDLWQSSGGTLMYDLVTAGYEEALKDERTRIIEDVKNRIGMHKMIREGESGMSRKLINGKINEDKKIILIIKNT